MLNSIKSFAVLLAAGAFASGLAGCEKREEAAGPGPAERAGQQIDQAAGRAGEELNKMAGKAGQGMQELGQKLQEKAEEAKKKE